MPQGQFKLSDIEEQPSGKGAFKLSDIDTKSGPPSLLQQRQELSRQELESNLPESTGFLSGKMPTRNDPTGFLGSRTREAAIGALEPFALQNLGPSLLDTVKKAGNVVLHGDAQGAADLAKGLITAPVKPVTNYVNALRSGDYDAAANASGGILSQTVPAVAGAGEILKAGIGALPSKVRAGQNLQKVLDVAKDAPLNTTLVDQIAGRAKELSKRGSNAPKIMRDYWRNQRSRTADFGGQQVTLPLNYEVGKDFASNAGRLSVAETMSTDKAMKAQVKQFAKAMKEADRDAAVRMGVGDLFDQGMREYRQASTISDAADVAKKWAVRAGLATAGLTGLKDFLR